MGKVLSVFGMGLIAARLPSPHGMLPPAFLAQLSVLSFNMLSPALLIANLAKQMNADRLMDLWPLVVWSICMSVFGLCLSYVVFRLIGVREEYLRTLQAAVAHPNAVSFPVIMLDSIVASPFFDNDPTAYERAIGVIFVYAIGWNVVFYSFTYHYILESKREEPDQVHTPTGAVAAAPRSGSISHQNEDSAPVAPMPAPGGFLFACKSIMGNPNMVATVISLMIAFWPALKYQLFTSGTVLRPIMQAVEFIGNGAIPLSSLVMAGNVAESLRRNFGIGGPKDRDVELIEQQQKLEEQRAAAETHADSAAMGAGLPTTRPLEQMSFSGRASSSYRQFEDEYDDKFADVETGGTAPSVGAAAAAGLRDPSGAAVAARPGFAHVVAGAPHFSINTVSHGDMTDDDDAVTARAHELADLSISALALRTDNDSVTEIHLGRVVSQEPGAGVISAPLNVTTRTVHALPGDTHVPQLPSPRLPPYQMAVFLSLRLVIMPTCCFLLLQLADLAGVTWLAPKDPLLRVMLLLINLAPSAEAILVVVTKTGMRRQALATSLLYLIQFGAVILTATIGLTIALIVYF